MRMTFATLTRQCAAALALGAALAGTAQASGVLYSQAAKAGGTATLSGDFPGLGAFQEADSFSLGGAASVTGFQWYGMTIEPGQLVVRLFTDLVGSPDTFTTLTGVITPTLKPGLFDDSNTQMYEYDMTLTTPLSVAGGQSYYLSVLSLSSGWAWLEGTGGDGKSAFRDIDGNPWQFDVPDLALSVIGDRTDGTVPEPSTLAMVALALAASAAAARRRNA